MFYEIIKNITRRILGKHIFNLLKRIFKKEIYGNIEALRSWSDNGLYIAAVEEALVDNKKFNKFKIDPRYRNVLEHNNFDQGKKYLEIINIQTPDILENIKLNQCKQNDFIGSPQMFNYGNLIGDFSPTTLHYMKVFSDIANIFDLSLIKNIAEIGVGYGGQTLIFDQLSHKKKFTLFDLYPVLKLVEKYLENFSFNGSYITQTLNQIDHFNSFDLVISNYAFSELPKSVQLKYIDKVLLKSKRGYLIMNSGSLKVTNDDQRHLTFNDLKKIIPGIKFLEENPLTSKYNYLIVWGKDK